MNDKLFDLIFDLFNEYDRGLWDDICYIDLADMWVSSLDRAIELSDGDDDKIDTHLKQLFRDKIEEALKE